MSKLIEHIPVTPFEGGYVAGFQKADPRECPYEKSSREYAEWQRGYTYAQQIREIVP